ncbi:MAG: GldG family protein [Verrucomicrobiota bacterium]
MAKNSSIDRARIGANVLTQIATVAFIVVMMNYLAFNHYRRWDFSRDHKYTLSEQTRRVLNSLKNPAENPVRITVFFSGDSDIFRDVESLLKEYDYAAKKRVAVEIIDSYMSQTRAREIVSKYKLGSSENVVIVDNGGHNKFVSAADMADYEPSFSPMEKPRLKTFKGEQALTSALIEVTEQAPNQIYVLAGHGEPPINSDTLSGIKTFIERQNIKLESLKLTDVEVVPPNAKALLIVGPKYDFSEGDLQTLRTFWSNKGRLFVFLEPGSPTPKLSAFLNEQGIAVNNDRVLKTMPIKLTGGMVTGVLKEITGDFVPGSPVTKRLNNVNAMFLGATQSLTLQGERVKANNIKLQPLIQASKGFWGETQFEIAGGGIFFDPKEDHSNPIVAASVEKGALSDERVQVDSSRLIVVGNATFIGNTAMTEADLDFFLSGLNWLLDREQLIGITPKPVRNLSLNLTDAQVSYLAMFTMVVIPAAAGLIGIFSWFKRRH